MIDATRPLLAITMGDPAGIGPEIVLKALAHADVFDRCRPLVIGDRRILERAAGWLGQSPEYDVVADPEMGSYEPGRVAVLDLENAPPERIPVGEESAAAGAAAVDYVFRACDLAMAGEVDAVVTAPLNKAAMHLAGYDFAGHTELLTEQTGAERVSMLLIGPNLRIVHVSTHVGLEEAIARVTQQRVEDVIQIALAASIDLCIFMSRLEVDGLTPP